MRPALCTAHAVKILTSRLLLLPTHLLRLLGRLEGRIHFLLVAGCKGRSALPTASSEGEYENGSLPPEAAPLQGADADICFGAIMTVAPNNSSSNAFG